MTTLTPTNTRSAHSRLLAAANVLAPTTDAEREGTHLDPCPTHPWCLGHDPGEQRTVHFGDLRWHGILGFYLHQTDGVTSITAHHESGHFNLIDPDEADTLADALRVYATAARAVAASAAR